ncbi:MAG TPA: hypothetical protein VMT37_12805 [Solirubrobacterales bacterium]|nr:hypothetical protein [Solirubrobacterales bacterium]
MTLVRRPGKRAAAAALTLAAALALLAILAAGAGSASAAGCPSFRVLHNDRIGAASFPAGPYTLTPSAGLTCARTSALFARFLEDWDGNLPGSWRVIAQGSGKAKFTNGAGASFSAEREGEREEEETNPAIGKLCPGNYVVNHTSVVGPLRFRRGAYLLYIPAGSAITCRRASVLFTKFLAQPGGRLPSPWQVKTQTATFYKPVRPLRSAFRLEVAGGVR